GGCVSEQSASSTFTVAAAPALVVTAPTDPNLPSCSLSEDITAAYNSWVAGFTVSGGCSPTSNIANIPSLPSDVACAGASLSFTLTADNQPGGCVSEQSASSTFTVAAAPALVVTAPTD